MRGSIANRLAFVGAGVGITLYAVFGLLYGSLLGGVAGLNIVHALFGTSLTVGVLPRIIVALGMLSGVLLAGTIFVAGSGAAGWSAGFLIDSLVLREKGALQGQRIHH